jgi:hypothetical protein
MTDYDVKLWWRLAGEAQWQVMTVKTRASSSVLAAQIALRSLEFEKVSIEFKGMTIERAAVRP